MVKRLSLAILTLLLPFAVSAQFYSGSQMEFGKNRVQYQDFKWSYFKFEKYETYFNTGGKELAIYVARSAKKHLSEIEKMFDYTLEDRIQFIIYNKQEDFKQSNIGLSSDDQYNVGGVTRIVGRKVFIYYEGDHRKLEEQIRAGIAEVLISQMMYGGNVKEVLKNSTLLVLPEWYTKGLVAYVSKGWNTEVDDRVRDGMLTGRFNKFNHLTGEEAVNAGHSIWYYISEKYGPSVISNLLYMTKVSRNVESSFMFVIGLSIKNLSYEWQDYYLSRFAQNDTTRVLPQQLPVVKKPKQTRVYSQLKVSPDGQNVVFATNELGQYKMFLYNTSTGKSKRLLKSGQKLDRINDYSYPIMAWHPSGQLFSYIYEKEGETFLTIYTLEDGSKITKPIFNFIKILDFAYSDDGKSLVMSAVQNGQTDIFVYNIAGGSAEPVTKDIYDDQHPRFVDGGRSIIFSSNREQDTMKSVSPDIVMPQSYDLWLYNYKSKSNVLRRLTNTPGVNEMQPAAWDSTRYSFVSDANGIRNRYVAYFDSTIAYIDTSAHYRYFARSMPVTNYARNILEQDIQPRASRYGEIIYNEGRYRMFIGNMEEFDKLKASKLKNTSYRNLTIEHARIDAEMDSLDQVKRDQQQKKKENGKLQTVKPNEQPKDTAAAKVNIDNYKFGKITAPDTTKPKVVSTSPDTAKTAAADSAQTGPPKDEFILPIARNYKVQYGTEYVVSQLDNSFLNQGYQRFTGGLPIYLNPGFTGLFKIGLSDLLEDHRIVAGVRLSGNLNSNEFLLSFEDREKRLDKQFVLHRQAFLNVEGSGASLTKIHTHQGRYTWRWPFNEVASVRGSLLLRNDRTVYLSTDYANLLNKNKYTNWGGGKIEFVFDNTIKRGLNIQTGTRFKIFGELFQGLDSIVLAKNSDNRFRSDLWVLGVDFRHYLKVHREIIWANRFAASTSLGGQRLIYYMGGVDNWFLPQPNNSIRISPDVPYAYQTLATPMRGHFQNIRNGNNFAVINSELRVPLFRYLFNRPMRSDFLNTFQVVGFGDVGTAWNGPNPYSEENALNTTVVGAPGNPITVILKNHKGPIVGGYGLGLRARIWGYFVRVDWARGVEDGLILDRVTYLSFSLDF
jgi:Tol biopolymer transport system component